MVHDSLYYPSPIPYPDSCCLYIQLVSCQGSIGGIVITTKNNVSRDESLLCYLYPLQRPISARSKCLYITLDTYITTDISLLPSAGAADTYTHPEVPQHRSTAY